MSEETTTQAEAPAEVTEKVEAPEVEKPAAEPVADSDGEEAGDKPEATDEGQAGDEAGDKPKKKSGIQRLKAREQYLRNENAELARQLEQLRTRSTQAAEADAPPKEEDFKGDYFAYQNALQAHNVRQVIREEKQRDQEATLEVRQREAKREMEIAHHERVAEAMDPDSDSFIADYAQVLGKMKGVNISAEVAEAIVESDKSALLAYYLANNPERLRELNGLSGRQLAREMGRLEGSVKRPAAKKQTTAPAPMKPIQGGASPAKSEADLAKSDDVSELLKLWRSKKSA